MKFKLKRSNFSTLKKVASAIEYKLATGRTLNLKAFGLAQPHRAPWRAMRDLIQNNIQHPEIVVQKVMTLISGGLPYEAMFLSSPNAEIQTLGKIYRITRLLVEKALREFVDSPESEEAQQNLLDALNNLASNVPGAGPQLLTNLRVGDRSHLNTQTDEQSLNKVLTPRSSATYQAFPDEPIAISTKNGFPQLVKPDGSFDDIPEEISNASFEEVSAVEVLHATEGSLNLKRASDQISSSAPSLSKKKVLGITKQLNNLELNSNAAKKLKVSQSAGLASSLMSISSSSLVSKASTVSNSSLVRTISIETQPALSQFISSNSVPSLNQGFASQSAEAAKSSLSTRISSPSAPPIEATEPSLSITTPTPSAPPLEATEPSLSIKVPNPSAPPLESVAEPSLRPASNNTSSFSLESTVEPSLNPASSAPSIESLAAESDLISQSGINLENFNWPKTGTNSMEAEIETKLTSELIAE